MFNNIGGKIKSVAKICCILGMLVHGAMGIYMFVFRNMAYGVAVIVIGCLVSWLGTVAIYGFGELIETTMDNNRQLRKIEKSLRQMQKGGSQEL